MQVDVRHAGLKQFRHLDLAQPERPVLEPALDARAAIVGLVEDQA
jgi:hypothetical protein